MDQRPEQNNTRENDSSQHGSTMKADQSLIDFVDHITSVIEIDQLRSVSDALFESGLSQGWPLSEQPGFATAGIRFGNLNLELCSVDRNVNGLNNWLTFEPKNLETLADQLTDRNVQYDPFDAVVIHGNPIYTRVSLPALETESTALQLCHLFYPTRLTGPFAPDNNAGIEQVREVRIGMNNTERKILNQLLAPGERSNTIRFKEGPLLSISNAQNLKILGMTVSTRDPIRATTTLEKAGMHRTDNQTVRIGSLEITMTSK